MKEFNVTKRHPATGRITIELEKTTNVIQDIRNLAQRVTKLLLTTPGRDIFHPNLGSGLKEFQRTIGREEVEAMKRKMAVKIMRVKEQVFTTQMEEELSDEERLKDLYVLSMDYDIAAGQWIIKLRLISEAEENLDLEFLRKEG